MSCLRNQLSEMTIEKESWGLNDSVNYLCFVELENCYDRDIESEYERNVLTSLYIIIR